MAFSPIVFLSILKLTHILLFLTCMLVVGIWIFPVVSKDAGLETVSKHGQLSADGVNLDNQYGERVQLKVMSLFWSVWMPYYYNKATVDAVKSNCHSNIARPMMAIDTQNGKYLTDPDNKEAFIYAVIDAAIEDIYILIDWQDFEAENHLEQSLCFFDRLSKKYGGYPNIIYEPYNELITLEWSDHEAVIKTIRVNDPDNLIVVGTPQWSQRLDLAAADPITEYDNIMYYLHFYAGTHQQWERDITEAAINSGLPVFVSEYGTVNADASPPVNLSETLLWYEFMEERGMSYVNFAVSDKDKGAAAMIPGTPPDIVCVDEYLTESGRIVVDHNKAL